MATLGKAEYQKQSSGKFSFFLSSCVKSVAIHRVFQCFIQIVCKVANK